MTTATEDTAIATSRRFAIYDDRELTAIITAVAFFPPAAQPGSTGNLVFHDHTGTPTAVFAAGTWTRAETAPPEIPDAPPANMEAKA
jgi:hypothetical protein